MVYKFTKDLETGNDLIDSEHRQLFDAINKLLDACTVGHGRAEIGEALDFLNSYVNKHFSDEENLQLKYRYPDYPNHKKYHETFKKVVQGLVDEYRQQGASIDLVAKTNTSVAGWLLNHIKKEDVKVAAHVRKCTS
ncbi:MAG TPA: hemerythrin [Ruminococcaceae bacterium]|jgi:hemerythrin|nr:hemerythrin [Oscillospiraceae bacterium]